MRKAFSVVLEVIAGFLFYAACLTVFASGLPIAGRLAILLAFSIPFVGAMLCGLALTRFEHWKRDAGVVVASASALALFVIIMVASMFATKEFKDVVTPDTIQFLKDYHYMAGSIVMVALASLGLILALFDEVAFWKNRNKKEQIAS